MDNPVVPDYVFPDTPLFRQYLTLRDQIGDALLLFRLGDFYELFGDQAERASKVLGLTLTTRDRNRPNPLPMCGIPARSLDLYLPRLIYQGHAVAIAEQTSPDSEGEGLFSRIERFFYPNRIVHCTNPCIPRPGVIDGPES